MMLNWYPIYSDSDILVLIYIYMYIGMELLHYLWKLEAVDVAQMLQKDLSSTAPEAVPKLAKAVEPRAGCWAVATDSPDLGADFTGTAKTLHLFSILLKFKSSWVKLQRSAKLQLSSGARRCRCHPRRLKLKKLQKNQRGADHAAIMRWIEMIWDGQPVQFLFLEWYLCFPRFGPLPLGRAWPLTSWRQQRAAWVCWLLRSPCSLFVHCI